MKARSIGLGLFLALASLAPSRIDDDIRFPDRVHKGQYYNLRTMISDKGIGAYRESDSEWKFKDLQILQHSKAGLLCEEWRESTILVRNYPYEKSLVDDDRFRAFLIRDGNYEYRTIGGGSRTVEAWDYGKIPTEGELRKFRDDIQNQISNKRAEALEARRIQDGIDKLKRQEVERRVIQNQMMQASNGYPSFQYELAVRYATGRGLETNLPLARHWLFAAMTNGSIEASNAFKKYFATGPQGAIK